MSVPALLYEFVLRKIDVTLITRYFRPYLTLKLHFLSVTLLLKGCNRAITLISQLCYASLSCSGHRWGIEVGDG